MATFYDISLAVQRGIRKKRSAIAKRRQRLALSILREILTTFPVDTGIHISNWAITRHPQNPFVVGTKPALVPGKRGTTRNANAKIVYERARFMVLQFKDPDHCLYISNTARCIETIEFLLHPGVIHQAIVRALAEAKGNLGTYQLKGFSDFGAA